MLRLATQPKGCQLAAEVRRHASEKAPQRAVDEQRHAGLARAGRRIGGNDLRRDRVDVRELSLAQE